MITQMKIMVDDVCFFINWSNKWQKLLVEFAENKKMQ